MSKYQKETVTIDVETVENWSKTLTYVITTLDFWIEKKDWPLDLCYDGIFEISNQMFDIVSRSHINDK